MLKVDLNSDLGEGYGAYATGDDAQMLTIVTSANVACGFHAGDPEIMARTFRIARKNGVSVDAHPGFPDLWGFGRRRMPFSTNEIERIIAYQIGAAQALAAYTGHRLTHVKAHGEVSNGRELLPGIDGRSLMARRYRDISAALITDSGGIDRCSEARLQLIRRFSAACVMAEKMEAKLVNGATIDITDHSQLSSTLVRLAQRIGIARLPIHDWERYPRRSRGCASIRMPRLSHQAVLGEVADRTTHESNGGAHGARPPLRYFPKWVIRVTLTFRR